MRKLLGLAIASLVLFGCANLYEKFYVDNLSKNPKARHLIIPSVGKPEIVSGSNDKKLDNIRMFENGYMSIGYSSFHATRGASRDNLIEQAKKVGAAKVLFYKKYMSTESGSVPITVPTTQTTYHSGGVSAYGTGGSAYGSYSGTSTTYGTSTSHIPYTRHRYEYGASFWVKIKMLALGVRFREPTPQEKSNAGTNKGAIIVAVRKGGPAFNADLVPNDLVLAINQEEIASKIDLQRTLKKYHGQLVTLDIIRKGQRIRKQVQLNN